MAVSPLINGNAVTGPAEKIRTSLGMQADVIGIASFYEDLIDTIIIDNIDSELSPKIRALGIEVFCTDIVMSNSSEKKRLAEEILFLAQNNNLPEVAER